MATLDDLPADQRAVLSLVLSRGRSYDEIATLLSIDRASVRDRALAALDALGPETDGSRLQRAVVTDYLLGQLPSGLLAQTRDRLTTSPGDRAWAIAVAQQLAPLSAAPLAQIPEAEPDHVKSHSSRRGGAILLAVLGIVVVVGAAVVVISLVAGTSTPAAPARTVTVNALHSTSTASTASQTASTTTTPKLRFITQVNLLSPDPTLAHTTAGIAQVLSDGTETGVLVVAQGMPANTRRDAYAVWLTDTAGGSDFLGFVGKPVGSNGKLEADGRLPSNASQYSRLLITLETSAHPKTPGTIVLEGVFKLTG